MPSDDMPSRLITEAGYWRDPVQVFMGIIWLLVGGVVGFFIGRPA